MFVEIFWGLEVEEHARRRKWILHACMCNTRFVKDGIRRGIREEMPGSRGRTPSPKDFTPLPWRQRKHAKLARLENDISDLT